MKPLVKAFIFVLFLVGCGDDRPWLVKYVQNKAKVTYDHVERDVNTGTTWTITTFGNGIKWTLKEINSCFSGGCDIRESLRGPNGDDGDPGESDTGNETCTVTRISNGVIVTCGEESAVIYDGDNGEDGDTGTKGDKGDLGEQGQTGENCSLVRFDKECKGKHLNYKLNITCGQDTEYLGKFKQKYAEECKK